MTAKHLECCVCGADAGKFQQHWNRDTGYGICPSCVAEEAGWHTAEELQSLYGKVGVNYDQPLYRHNGRRFKVRATFRNTLDGTRAANDWMSRNDGTGVLDITHNGLIIIADLADEGVPV